MKQEPWMAGRATSAKSFRSVTKESYVTRVRNASRRINGEGALERLGRVSAGRN